MKKSLQIILSVILLGVYIVSTMGFGIHQCSTDHTTKVLLLAGENPCSHTHNHGVCECGHHHHHDASCCNTKVYVVDEPSVASHNIVTLSAPVLDIALSYGIIVEGPLFCTDGLCALFNLPWPPYIGDIGSQTLQGACVSLRL